MVKSVTLPEDQGLILCGSRSGGIRHSLLASTGTVLMGSVRRNADKVPMHINKN